VRNRAQKIQMLLSDVDGVMTDGSIILGSNGQEFKIFSAQDGMAITMAKKAGIKIGIITGRKSSVVTQRAQELAIDEVFQGNPSKLEAYFQIRQKYNLRDDQIAYMGDDIGDLGVMGQVGMAIAVANGVPEIKERAHYVTQKPGGAGAIREVVDLILEMKGIKDQVITGLIGL
jgi:3-deoxy-D-manno-octulosonate 8-phosphate phosphatase (KDO 8-P phosphatase)